MDNLNYNIIVGMDWFTRVNPQICWKTKTITIQRNDVNFNILKDPNDLLLRDTVFVQLIEEEYSYEQPNTTGFKVQHYNKINNTAVICHNPEIQALLKEYAHVFKEKLTDLPPNRAIKNLINLCKAMPKALALY